MRVAVALSVAFPAAFSTVASSPGQHASSTRGRFPASESAAGDE